LQPVARLQRNVRIRGFGFLAQDGARREGSHNFSGSAFFRSAVPPTRAAENDLLGLLAHLPLSGGLARWVFPNMNPKLVAFVRAPRPGQVKTRLAKTLGGEAAAEAYKTLMDQLF